MLQYNIYLLLTKYLDSEKNFSPPLIVYIWYYLGTLNPFYSFYNNLMDFYLTSYHTQLHNAGAHFRVILNDIMIHITYISTQKK